MSLQVTIERDQCISCCNCSTECPEVFEHSPDDGLSQIVAKHRVTPKALGKGELPESQRSCAQIATDACPVQIIHLDN
jgi:ferredoxin